ncbi:cytochrome bd oxidase small subunit CydS [Alteribacter populi]
MDLTTFLIMLAPPIVLVLSVAVVFIWGAKAKPPHFLQDK